MNSMKQSLGALTVAIRILKNGGIVICPTDTVYGFLADATNKKAVEKIYNIKKRPKSKPLPVFVKDFKMANTLADVDARQAKMLKKYWPGKYTFILKRKLGHKLYGVDKKTIALRIPNYKFLNNILEKINRSLVQTSVNISGENPFTAIDDIVKTFGSLDILIIDGGDIKKRKSSKVLDLTTNKIKILR